MDNQVIGILKTVIRQYGDNILVDTKLCRALLQDHCAGAYAHEVKLLLFAQEEGVATDLRTPPVGLPAMLLGARLVDRMVEEWCLERAAAEWTVHAWANALGVSLPASSTMAGVATRNLEQHAIPNTHANTLTGKLASPGIEFIPIPAGDFLYGENKERKHLPAYEIMKYPVTVEQYRQFCEATGWSMPSAPTWGWQDTHPVVNVTWHDVAAFAEWAGLALPTEEEWEKAARGTDGREYPWGNGFSYLKCCHSVGQSAGQTAPVGRYPAGASPYGVQDMAGNVWEWCDSWFSVNSTRVLRGGGWNFSEPDLFRTTGRSYINPASGYYNCGFRCVSRSPGR